MAVGEYLRRQQSIDDIYRQVTRAAAAGLGINLSLGGIKLISGWYGHSLALMADAVNSLGDSIATLVVIAALYVARRPADAEHPYGHTRAEGIAATTVATLIIVSGSFVVWEGIERLFAAPEVPAMWTLWVAGTNVLLKEALFRYHLHVGQRTGSASLLANAWDHRADALSALAALGGLGLIYWRGAAWVSADAAASMFVGLIIIVSGMHQFRVSSSELMDLQADTDLVEAIQRVAEGIDGVEGVETLWVRKSGLEYFVDIHIEVDPHLTVYAGHAIGHRVKARLLEEFPRIRDVLVHLEPASVRHEEDGLEHTSPPVRSSDECQRPSRTEHSH
ncbi:MAG: hypothetical protein KatS3mg111_3675 [Pirellulaceae bacterium]|nr:MAG: hypothetical protein KatS3mg111_3675 [Pirellulaceae bacterium]